MSTATATRPEIEQQRLARQHEAAMTAKMFCHDPYDALCICDECMDAAVKRPKAARR